jgi:hypothetical protein
MRSSARGEHSKQRKQTLQGIFCAAHSRIHHHSTFPPVLPHRSFNVIAGIGRTRRHLSAGNANAFEGLIMKHGAALLLSIQQVLGKKRTQIGNAGAMKQGYATEFAPSGAFPLELQLK